WFVGAWMPLYLAAGVGLCEAGRRAAGYGRWAVAGAAAASVGWAVAVNRPLLDLRDYDLAENFGRIYLDNVEPRAVVILASDDPNALCAYLQRVRGDRTDVTLVMNTFLFNSA